MKLNLTFLAVLFSAWVLGQTTSRDEIQSVKQTDEHVSPSVSKSDFELGERDKVEIKRKRDLWIEQAHRAAPGVSWRVIEQRNKIDAYFSNLSYRKNESNSLFNYANGQLCGTWAERGSKNQAGRCWGMDYFKSDNSLYTLSNDGSLFKGVPDSAHWHSQNDQLAFNNHVIKVIKNGAGNKRIVLASGLNVFYSDDDGLTFNQSTGISFPVAWGGNTINEIESLTDTVTNSTTLYLITRPWDSGPWAPRFWLYSSVDYGQSWQQIFTFNDGGDNRLHLWKPNDQESLVYAFFDQNVTGLSAVYSISGANNVTVVHSSADFPSNTDMLFSGNRTGGNTTLYATSGGTELYKSTDLGSTWTHVSTLPLPTGVLAVSPNNANKVFIGQVDAYRSNDGGVTWTQVNSWTDYYLDPEINLHADIFNIKFYKKANGSSFIIINCDGGCYRSDDEMQTVTNIGLHDLNVSEYYSVISDASTNLFMGSQDQGLQRVSNSGANTNILDFDQIISGDYGKLQLTRNGQTLWAEYPGGHMYYYYNATGPYTQNWALTGSTLPVYGWMLATAPIYPASLNQIYLAGGNLSGGSGSYLIKLNGIPTSIIASQKPYDFRGSSTAGISAIGTTPLDTFRVYVAKEDGAFYYSNDNAQTWTQSNSFTGPNSQYLFGNCIYASRLTHDLVFFGGSGYSNPPVYASNDGGANFADMSNGLPPTLIFGFAADAAEKFLFAATEAGPYVFVFADSTWYPIGGGIAPALAYWAVDYDTTNDVAHFATFGRGVWDFTVCLISNTDELSQSKTEVYPNPFSASTTISFQNPEQKKCTISIYDIQGRVVREVKGISSNKVVLEKGNLHGGIYFYRINSESGMMGNGKMTIE